MLSLLGHVVRDTYLQVPCVYRRPHRRRCAAGRKTSARRRRRCAGVSRRRGLRVSSLFLILISHYTWNISTVSCKFTHVSANAAFRDSHYDYTHLNLFWNLMRSKWYIDLNLSYLLYWQKSSHVTWTWMTSLLRIILIRIVLGGTFGTHGIPRYSNSRYCTAGAEVTIIFGTTIPCKKYREFFTVRYCEAQARG